MSPMIPKDRKIYILHYDDVRGEVLRPPYGTTPAAVPGSHTEGQNPFEYPVLNIKVMGSSCLPGCRWWCLWLRLFVLSLFLQMPWMRSGSQLSQFLRDFLPTL